MSSDPGPAASPGSPALMGQDGALAGHEVPGGEVVQLLGKSAEHLLVRPAPPQRCDPRIQLDMKFSCLHCNFCILKLLPSFPQRVPSEGGSPALRRL